MNCNKFFGPLRGSALCNTFARSSRFFIGILFAALLMLAAKPATAQNTRQHLRQRAGLLRSRHSQRRGHRSRPRSCHLPRRQKQRLRRIHHLRTPPSAPTPSPSHRRSLKSPASPTSASTPTPTSRTRQDGHRFAGSNRHRRRRQQLRHRRKVCNSRHHD